MNEIQFFDILVAKEYESKQENVGGKRTAWNKIGRAWQSRSGDSMSFELYHLPNQRYVISMKNKRSEQDFAAEQITL